MEKNWTVVKFTTENAVEAVPTSWILGHKCYWPSYSKEKLLTSIKKHEEPNTCWPLHDIVIFRNATFDDYLTAREKAKKAEYNSDLTSDTDKSLRKWKKKRRISSSSEEEGTFSILPEPPKLPKIGIDMNNEETDSCKSITEKATTSGNINIHSCCCCPQHKTGDSIKLLIKQQVLTRQILNEVLEEIRKVKSEINVNNNYTQSKEVVSLFVDFQHFPIDSTEKMKHLEDYLEDGAKFKAAVNEISKIGGSTIYDFTKRCLSSIMTNKFASEYSWYGAKKKLIFGQLKLAELLLEAAVLSKLADNRKTAEEAIKTWLRRAKERHLSAWKKKEMQEDDETEDIDSILLFH